MNAVVRKAGRFCPTHGERYIAGDTLKQKNPLTGEESEIQNPMMGRCTACHAANNDFMRVGKRAPQPKREPNPVEVERYAGFGNPTGRIDEKDYAKYLEGLLSDPVRLASVLCDARRPRGVSRAAFGQATRAAASIPMLNANAESIQRGFLIKPTGAKLPKSKLFRTVLVKPLTSKSANASGGWHTREWSVYTLKYTKGLVLVTNRNEESKVFNGWGSLRKAIEDSGFEVIR